MIILLEQVQRIVSPDCGMGLGMRLDLLYTVSMVTHTEGGKSCYTVSQLGVVCLHVSGQGCMEVIAIVEIF